METYTRLLMDANPEFPIHFLNIYSIKRRWGWMDGMVNTCELSINVVKSDKPKMLTGLGQNGTVAGIGAHQSPVMDIQRYRWTEST
jgi:hypothetical protein